MAYSTNPNLPKARATAMQLLIREQLPPVVVARKCGIHRSTVWRWKRKWDKLNQNVQFDNPNRPTRPVSLRNKLVACTWRIPTESSRPHSSPRSLSEAVVARVLELRATLKRCAEVIWHHLTTVDLISISLNSVRRTLKRHHCFDGAQKKRVRPDNPKRPLPTYVGELVETDTIHYVCPKTGRRLYVYTVIDVCSRLAYAEIYPRILPGLAARVIIHARQEFGFEFRMVQADNGPEFSSYFKQVLSGHDMPVRHTRLGRPNDNAHIERFNRTIQEECLGRTIHYSSATKHLQTKINNYLEHYNYKRVHLGLKCETPASVSSRLRRS